MNADLRRAALFSVIAATLVGVPAFAATEWAAGQARSHLRADLSATAVRAADSAAGIVGERVLGAQRALSSAAQGLLVQYGAARKDRAVLSGILADLRPLIGAADDIQYVFAIDQAGALLAADPPAPELQDPASLRAPWSVQVREGRAAISDVYASAFRGSPPAVVVAVPVRDGFGQPAGALAAAIDLSRAGDWLGGLAGPASTIRLLDGRGVLIGDARPDADSRAIVASREVTGLGWRVEVATPATVVDAGLAPLTAISRLLALALTLLAFLGAAALSIAWGRVRSGQADASREREAVTLAGRQRVVFLDRFSQSLRTPLNSIVGFSGLLEEQLADTGFAVPERRWVRNIRAETAQLVSLTSDAFDLSSFDAEGMELRPRAIGIGELMAPVGQAADTAALAREVLMVHDTREALVRLDVERVRRIASAIVERAIRRAPAGGRISVTSACDKDTFQLTVDSTSAGLPAERVAGVREALGGLPDPTDEPGAGLALAVAARMATAHGGSITYAEDGEHTGTFRVRIPLSSVKKEVA